MQHNSYAMPDVSEIEEQEDDVYTFWDQALQHRTAQRLIVVALATGLLCAQPPPALPTPSPNTPTITSGLIPTARVLRVTISAQAGMARVLAGLALTGHSMTMCSVDGSAMNVGGGVPWQVAEQHGLQLLNLHVASVAATQARAKSKWEIVSVFGAETLYDLSLAAAANIPRVNAAKTVGKLWRMAPIILGHKLSSINAQREKVQPNPIATFGPDMLDPTVMYAIPAGAGLCVQKLLIAAPGGPGAVNGEVLIQ